MMETGTMGMLMAMERLLTRAIISILGSSSWIWHMELASTQTLKVLPTQVCGSSISNMDMVSNYFMMVLRLIRVNLQWVLSMDKGLKNGRVKAQNTRESSGVARSRDLGATSGQTARNI